MEATEGHRAAHKAGKLGVGIPLCCCPTVLHCCLQGNLLQRQHVLELKVMQELNGVTKKPASMVDKLHASKR
ncbi:hypothetical protein OPV22_027378 [Ensete ventricosum]|uniref:Uncharacterized protein n=1 Tax=Ensete ventricosum TaxID=4639 RepID=A0AAV8Q5L7_ENSVE|nr:hypothetical protein OPV22_027378 [Ensete ventricosum]